MPHRLLPTALLLCLLALLPARAQEPPADPGPPDPEKVAERILELQDEIEALLEGLSPEARRQVERILAARSAPPDGFEPEGAPAPEPAAPAEPAPAPAPVRPAEPSCNLLEPFDTDGDGVVSARDRYWRYLYLWRDGNGDRQIQTAETVDLYEAGVAEIAVALDSAKLREGGRVRMEADRYVLLELDDFQGLEGVLAVDTDRLARGSGPAVLPEEDGAPLSGIQPIEVGWQLSFDDGETVVLTCG